MDDVYKLQKKLPKSPKTPENFSNAHAKFKFMRYFRMIRKGPPFFAKLKNFFAKLIFFPPKLFLVFWKRKIFLSKKNFGGKKST
jgi:hypothetical protein